MQSAPPAEAVELDLLRTWREPLTPRRLLRDGAGSLLIHVLIVCLFLFIPDAVIYKESPSVVANFKNPTQIYLPPELTQKAPNQGKVLKELDVRSAVQAQPAQAPHVRQFNPPPGAPTRVPEALAPETASAAAPQLQIATEAGQAPNLGASAMGLNAPTTLGAPPRPVAPAPAKKPQAPVPDPLRQALRSGGGGVTVGDIEDSPRVPGLPPSPCTDCSALQLLSDPNNVDFKPYLLQILARVKSKWLAVIPESARQGRRGVVVLRFSIDRQGNVIGQLEFPTPTGTDLDFAAATGISASVPFPPLPAEYRGDHIRLQMAFAYNMSTPAR